jgi:hypothetical protein
MAAEVALEFLALALEATRFTAVTPPTHILNLDGVMTPRITRRRGSETRGVLTEFYRSKHVYKFGEWEGSGALDTNIMPVLLNMAVAANATPTGTGPYVWTFSPANTDTVKLGTLYWGDPNEQIFQGAGSTLEELTISANADSEDVVMLDASGSTTFPAKVSAPTWPSQVQAVELVPQDMQLWIDTATIGTTAITGRLISVEISLTNNISLKRRANGPASALTYNGIGRGRRHLEMNLVMEFEDQTQYDQWVAGTTLKTRVRMNGPLISGSDYHYFQTDIYGPFDGFDWEIVADTNRTVSLTIISEYDATTGYDWQMVVQNSRATL